MNTIYIRIFTPHTHLYRLLSFFFFFLNDPPTPEISPLPLHAPLPISRSPRTGRCPAWTCPPRRGPWTSPGPGRRGGSTARRRRAPGPGSAREAAGRSPADRSEEHTSELQSQSNLVCRLLLEKKKKKRP